MEFVVKFSVTNAAFDDDRMAAVAEVLSKVQAAVRQGREHGLLFDSNGNRIGSFGLEED
jgi:hypothetical protein